MLGYFFVDQIFEQDAHGQAPLHEKTAAQSTGDIACLEESADFFIFFVTDDNRPDLRAGLFSVFAQGRADFGDTAACYENRVDLRMAAEHFQGLFPGVFRSFQYITYIPDTETGEEVIHIADKGLFPLLVGDHVVAGDNADPGGTVHEKTEHAGGYAAGLNCILPNIAENSFHRGLRVDENNGNIQIDQAPDGVRDFLGADRKNDRAGISSAILRIHAA